MTEADRQHADPPVGLLVVDKPLGWSSMDVVRRVRRAAGGVKTGHAGTLDPLATGVVVCCLGKATKSVNHLMGLKKIYEATVDLSAFAATDDRESRLEHVHVETPPTEQQVRQVLVRFTGDLLQTPPAFSALHVGGRRAYKLARSGEPVDLKPRAVRIDAIELLDYQWPQASLRVTCGKGTYIRSLARDMGKALNTGGHLAALRRTAVGGYDLSIAVDEHRLRQPITQADLLSVPESV